jgi:nucleoside-diphosphate-sugar epimerase
MAPVDGQDQVRHIDIRDLDTADLAGHDAIIHLAGLSNDPLSDLDPALTRAVNHAATTRLAEVARGAGVGQFVFSSTCSVYGFHGDAEITETSALNPLTVYAESKVAAEQDLTALAAPGFKVTHLRHGTAYGASPMTRFDLVVNNLVAWAHATGAVRLKSAGDAWRPLVHVEDICASFVAALNDDTVAPVCRVFNIGITRDNMRILDLARMIAAEMEAPLEFAEGAEPDHRSYRVNADLALGGLPGFAPCWTVGDGIRQVIAQVRAAGLAIDDVEGAKFGRIAHLRHLMATGRVDADLRWTGGQLA